MKKLNVKRFATADPSIFEMYTRHTENYDTFRNCISVTVSTVASLDITQITKNGVDVSNEWSGIPGPNATKTYTSNITETLTFYGSNGQEYVETIDITSIETNPVIPQEFYASNANIKINSDIKVGKMSLKEIDDTVSTLFDLIYPVGSIYYTNNANFSPNVSFNGTWELIKDRFLLGAGGNYSLGTTGGSNTHNHILSSKGGANIRKYGNTFYQGDYTTAGTMPPQTDGHWWLTTGNADTSSTTNPGTKGIGVGLYGTTDDKNTLPPYLAVYIWKRVS